MSFNLKDCSQSCIVELCCKEDTFFSDIEGTNGPIVSSCSSLVIDKKNGLILTPVSCISPFLNDKEENVSKHLIQNLIQSLDISIILEKDAYDEGYGRGSYKTSSIDTVEFYFTSVLNFLSSERKKSHEYKSVFNTLKGKCVHIWKVESFSSCIQTVMSSKDGWMFQNDYTHSEFENQCPKLSICDLIASFMIIQVCDNAAQDITKNMNFDSKSLYHLKHMYNIILPSLKIHIGDPVRIMGTPFGSLSPTVFMNSINDGIISNMYGSNNVFLIIDSQCVPGTEGGIIYSNKFKSKKQILGILVSSLCWKNNDLMGISIGCSMSEILSSLFHSVEAYDIHFPLLESRKIDEQLRNFKEYSNICFIRTSIGNMGSGIIMDRKNGLILTCSHVINFDKYSKVQVGLFPHFELVPAQIIFCNEKDVVFDLALLKVDPSVTSNINENSLKVAIPKKGALGYVLGFTIHNEQNIQPSITKGIIAKIIEVDKKPVMIQTNCNVMPGASGGALLSKYGQLLGIVVCNTRDVQNSILYPTVNMSIPISIVWKPLKKYLLTKDISHLACLNLADKTVNDIWKLNDAVKSKL